VPEIIPFSKEVEKVVFNIQKCIHDFPERPSIWNSSSQEYVEGVKKHSCGLEICCIHHTDSEELDEKKLRDTGMQLCNILIELLIHITVPVKLHFIKMTIDTALIVTNIY
jgi:hypothetical protein